MKKILYLLLPLLAVALTACNDDNDTLNTTLIKGQWELTGTAPDSGCIYYFNSTEHTWSWGWLTTYRLSADGTPTFERAYDWHVTDPANSDPVILTLTPTQPEGAPAAAAASGAVAEADEGASAADASGVEATPVDYIVESLSATTMVLSQGGTTLTFTRRNDLPTPW